MFQVDLVFPFTLGLVAAFNPCGFAMLPAYLGMFLGSNENKEHSSIKAVLQALKVGGALTAGFVAVFGTFGILTSAVIDQSKILPYVGYVTIVFGVLMIPLGIAMIRGFELKVNLPRLQLGGESNQVVSMFLFGVSYAVVSLSCTVGLFLSVVTDAFISSSFIDGVSVFLAYAFGMGAVIITLTLALALARTGVATNMKKVLPWVNRISGMLLLLAGIYLLFYGWWEIQVLRGNLKTNFIIDLGEKVQSSIVNRINNIGPAKLGVAFLIFIAVVVVAAFTKKLASNKNTGTVAE